MLYFKNIALSIAVAMLLYISNAPAVPRILKKKLTDIQKKHIQTHKTIVYLKINVNTGLETARSPLLLLTTLALIMIMMGFVITVNILLVSHVAENNLHQNHIIIRN